jgi:hypothetical protein
MMILQTCKAAGVFLVPSAYRVLGFWLGYIVFRHDEIFSQNIFLKDFFFGVKENEEYFLEQFSVMYFFFQNSIFKIK